MQFGTTARNNMIDTFVSHVGASAKLRFMTGSMPATPATSQTGTQLFELSLPSTWLNAASGGQATKAGTWSGTAAATGTIGYARLLNSGATTVHWQGTVTAAFSLSTSATSSAGSNVLTFTSTTGVTTGMQIAGAGIPTGATVLSLTSTTVTMSAVSTAGVSSGTTILFGDVTGDMNLSSIIVTSVGQTLTIDTFTVIAPGA